MPPPLLAFHATANRPPKQEELLPPPLASAHAHAHAHPPSAAALTAPFTHQPLPPAQLLRLLALQRLRAGWRARVEALRREYGATRRVAAGLGRGGFRGDGEEEEEEAGGEGEGEQGRLRYAQWRDECARSPFLARRAYRAAALLCGRGVYDLFGALADADADADALSPNTTRSRRAATTTTTTGAGAVLPTRLDVFAARMYMTQRLGRLRLARAEADEFAQRYGAWRERAVERAREWLVRRGARGVGGGGGGDDDYIDDDVDDDDEDDEDGEDGEDQDTTSEERSSQSKSKGKNKSRKESRRAKQRKQNRSSSRRRRRRSRIRRRQALWEIEQRAWEEGLVTGHEFDAARWADELRVGVLRGQVGRAEWPCQGRIEEYKRRRYGREREAERAEGEPGVVERVWRARSPLWQSWV